MKNAYKTEREQKIIERIVDNMQPWDREDGMEEMILEALRDDPLAIIEDLLDDIDHLTA